MKQEMKDSKSFWNWSGTYIGYRLDDSLFSSDGRQLGLFYDGDEVYACDGHYLGEIRNGDRLISNVTKKRWTRGLVTPSVRKQVPGFANASSKEMLPSFEEITLG